MAHPHVERTCTLSCVPCRLGLPRTDEAMDAYERGREAQLWPQGVDIYPGEGGVWLALYSPDGDGSEQVMTPAQARVVGARLIETAVLAEWHEAHALAEGLLRETFERVWDSPGDRSLIVPPRVAAEIEERGWEAFQEYVRTGTVGGQPVEEG